MTAASLADALELGISRPHCPYRLSQRGTYKIHAFLVIIASTSTSFETLIPNLQEIILGLDKVAEVPEYAFFH